MQPPATQEAHCLSCGSVYDINTLTPIRGDAVASSTSLHESRPFLIFRPCRLISLFPTANASLRTINEESQLLADGSESDNEFEEDEHDEDDEFDEEALQAAERDLRRRLESAYGAHDSKSSDSNSIDESVMSEQSIRGVFFWRARFLSS